MKYLKIMSLLVLAMVMVNCSDDPPPEPVVEFFADVNGTEVTFNSTVTNASSLVWSFGDGNTSTEADPVHAYETPGNYTVTLTATGSGGEDTDTQQIEILETVEYLLSGGAARTEGKTWKMKYEVSDPVGKEGAGLVENALGIMLPIDEDGFLDWITLSGGYDDAFTFVFDGTYMVDNADGNSLMALLYASLNHFADIKAVSTEADVAPLADVTYTPKSDATWSLNTEDFTVNAINYATQTPEAVTFTGKTQLVLDEYFAYKDASNVVIIKEISETEMTVAITINVAEVVPDAPVLMFHMTFEAQ